jgi:hypothetical protein
VIEEEPTRPDTLQAILNECLLTREAAVTAADCAMATKVEVNGIADRMGRLEARVTRLENLQGLVPFAALVISIVALLAASVR